MGKMIGNFASTETGTASRRAVKTGKVGMLGCVFVISALGAL